MGANVMKNRKVIGRKQEVSTLLSAYNSNRPEFLAIYGRRRVGKTYLVTSLFMDKENTLFFYVSGIKKGNIDTQLWAFRNALSEAFYQGAPLMPSSNWTTAFELLQESISKFSDKHTKIILFFDELPWLATPRSGVLERLDYYWNRHWSYNNNIKLIVCGSAASWIQEKILEDTGGFHNRVTKTINLLPLDLSQTNQYLIKNNIRLSNQDVLQLYLAIGGIPFYLNMVQPSLSATENINQMLFLKSSELRKEFDRLFKSLYKNSEVYIELIKIIAKKRFISLTEIVKQTKLSKEGGTLTKHLTTLEASGFISSFISYKKTKGKLYLVTDAFCLFHLKWLDKDNPLQISTDNDSYWIANSESCSYKVWSGYAFEILCYKHVDIIRNALNLPGNATAHTWQHRSSNGDDDKGAQIDLLFDRPDNAISLCEIKYSHKPYCISKKLIEEFENKAAIFKKVTKEQKNIFYILITSAPVKESEYINSGLLKHIDLSEYF